MKVIKSDATIKSWLHHIRTTTRSQRLLANGTLPPIITQMFEFKIILLQKLNLSIHISSNPPGLHLPGYSPPLQLPPMSSLLSGGTSSLAILVVATPPPILHPLDPHSTHLAPPVHQNWPFEILLFWKFSFSQPRTSSISSVT